MLHSDYSQAILSEIIAVAVASIAIRRTWMADKRPDNT